MNALKAAQAILVERTVSVYTDMRDTVDSPSEYRDHFGNMGELIAKIESYPSFGDICSAIEKEEFGIIGLVGDDEEMWDFLGEVKNLMARSAK